MLNQKLCFLQWYAARHELLRRGIDSPTEAMITSAIAALAVVSGAISAHKGIEQADSYVISLDNGTGSQD